MASDEELQGGVVTKARKSLLAPPFYKVMLHNDDYTPMDFVITVLQKYFHKDHQEATQIMLIVHNEGKALCGIFPYEIAETKVVQVTKEATANEYPLKCTLEKDA